MLFGYVCETQSNKPEVIGNVYPQPTHVVQRYCIYCIIHEFVVVCVCLWTRARVNSASGEEINCCH